MSLIKKISFLMISLCWLSIGGLVNGNEAELKVIALFQNAAMVEINGKQKLYRNGQQVSKGITLESATPHVAIFSIDGKRVELGLKATQQFNANYQQNQSQDTVNDKTAKIVRNNQGMYRTPGFINGVGVTFLVDTGASQVAMNERVAQRIGLLYKINGRKVGVSTAAGLVNAWAVPLNKVRVGSIELRQVEALVVQGAGPEEVLLGMSFLNRVKIQDDGQLMTLIKKY